MALRPATPLVDGEFFTDELANLAFNQVYDDQPQYLGHHEKIPDEWLDDKIDSLKGRFAAVQNAFKVSVESGLILRHQSGIVRLADGQNLTKTGSLISALDNRTSYVYINQSGDILCSELPAVNRLLLAKVIAIAGRITSLEDLRHPSILSISPVSRAIKVFGGTSTIDKVVVSGEVFDQGLYYFRNFTVPAGVRITIDRYAKIYCSGSVTIDGEVEVTPMGFGAIAQAYVLPPSGSVGGAPGQGLGHRGIPYPWGAQTWGSGGRQGELHSSQPVTSWGFSWYGGDGGGCLWLEVAGKIIVNGLITARGTRGGRGGTGAMQESSTGGNTGAVISGAGGGSGGLIALNSLIGVLISPTAILDVQGGNGGDGYLHIPHAILGGSTALGGSGGGGGYIVLMSPDNNTTGATLRLEGGRNGSAQGTNLVQTGPNTYQHNEHLIYLGGGIGGAFGGGSLGSIATRIGTSNSYIIETFKQQIGKLVIRNFTPVGS